MTTIKTRTYTATLRPDGSILVRGLHARAILAPHPDTGAALERRNSLRADILDALWAAGAKREDYYGDWAGTD